MCGWMMDGHTSGAIDYWMDGWMDGQLDRMDDG